MDPSPRPDSEVPHVRHSITPAESRPALLRRIGLVVLILGLTHFGLPGVSQAIAGSEAAKAGTPNLLFLIADDHRGGTLGVDGDPRRATPRLDELAGQGVRFTRAYCNSPVCTPSRQSLITGRLPHAVGVTRLTTPLPHDAVTLGNLLTEAGYETAAYGKMHFNSQDRHGFAERLDLKEWHGWLREHLAKGDDRRRPWRPFKDPASEWLNSTCRPVGLPAAAMDSTYFADRAIDYLKSHKDRPFALVVSFYDPHSPFHFPDEWHGRFRPKTFPALAPSDADLRERPLVFKGLTPHDSQGIQAAYYTSLSFLDHQVGRVLDGLNAAGLSESTLVVYLGDNGYMLGEHGRFEKHCFYEPAVRVPLLVRWPRRLPAGGRVEGMVELVDVLPSVLDLLGVDRPRGLHGQSFVPLLRGEKGAQGRDVVFSEYLENEEAMVRGERYKLVMGTGRRKRLDGYETARPTPGSYARLFDMAADPSERHDLAGRPEFKGVEADLQSRLHQRLISTRDGALVVPAGLTDLQAIHWCLVPRDPEPPSTPPAAR